MKTKETGSVFVAKCPICKDELVVGWLRDGLAKIDPKSDSKTSATDVNGMATDKQTCTCGQLRFWFDLTKGRAVAEWDKDVEGEPMVGNVNLH